LFIIRENEDKFQGMVDILRGHTSVELLIYDFYLENLVTRPPTYEKYTELDIAYKKMKSLKYPSRENGELLIQLLTG
jgi:hypothetical protein